MNPAVYNSAIPKIIWNSVNRVLRCIRLSGVLPLTLLLAIFAAAISARAADWNSTEQQLARKIVAVTGPGAVAVTVENRSSLGRRDSEIVQNGLRVALEQVGIHIVKPEQAAATVAISLSENATSYVWVAEIHQGNAESAVAMVSLPRTGRPVLARDSMPLNLHRTLLWTQDDPILDVAVLEESGTPTHIAVLSSENVSLYRMQAGKWQQEQALEIVHALPWPRDLRGRLLPAQNHLFDVYLPGVTCQSTTTGAQVALNCRDTDDPWPIVAAFSGISTVFPSAGSAMRPSSAPIPPMTAFFAPSRNFFTGVLAPAIGKFGNVPKFYSAAFVPRDKYTLWLFAAVDGKVHEVDGMNDQTTKLDWGSDIVSVRTKCGAGWQILASTSGMPARDSIRVYELPDRDPVAVSAPMELPGTVSALWTESRGDTAIAVVKNQETGSYEAYRLDLACSQ
jgi:hypothetical protein